jgi:hypothetical protein
MWTSVPEKEWNEVMRSVVTMNHELSEVITRQNKVLEKIECLPGMKEHLLLLERILWAEFSVIILAVAGAVVDIVLRRVA